MNSKENIKDAVWTAIRSNDMFSFDDMMRSMELSLVELSVIIGLLLKEKKVSLCINHAFISEKGTYKSRQEDLFSRFMDLLSEHVTRELSVSFYASRLCITTKYLSTVVRQVSGKTPTVWIKEKIISEMKYRLCCTQATIKEISYSLNFPNNSFFGKYFKAETGVSPSRYREIHCDCNIASKNI